MDQSCQGQCSTFSLPPTHEPPSSPINECHQPSFHWSTRYCPITSNHGHAYLIIFYVYIIASIPIKNHTTEELLRAYQITYKNLSNQGLKPQLHKMDRKTSCNINDFVKPHCTTLQYTPLDIHRTNPTKQSIHTWKNHFIVGIASLPKMFPIANWWHLTNQYKYTINMLCPCWQSPLLLQFKAMEGSYYSFDATPIAPPGISCFQQLVHQPIA